MTDWWANSRPAVSGDRMAHRGRATAVSSESSVAELEETRLWSTLASGPTALSLRSSLPELPAEGLLVWFRRPLDLVLVRQLFHGRLSGGSAETTVSAESRARMFLSHSVAAEVEPVSERLHALLTKGLVDQARELASRVGGSWRRALAPPNIRVASEPPSAGPGAFRANAEWLEANRDKPEYKGKWVALRAGEVLAADQSRVSLQKNLRRDGVERGALVVRMV